MHVVFRYWQLLYYLWGYNFYGYRYKLLLLLWLYLLARAALMSGRLPIRNGFYTTNAHARNGESRELEYVYIRKKKYRLYLVIVISIISGSVVNNEWVLHVVSGCVRETCPNIKMFLREWVLVSGSVWESEWVYIIVRACVCVCACACGVCVCVCVFTSVINHR